MKDALPGSLAEADRVFCYSANLGWDAAAALAPMNMSPPRSRSLAASSPQGARQNLGRPGVLLDKAVVTDDLSDLVARIAAAAAPGDHVLVMSNGGFGGIHDKLLAALAAR